MKTCTNGPTHELDKIETRITGIGTEQYRSVCDCGRRAPWYPDRDLAERMHRIHTNAIRARERAEQDAARVTGERP